MRSRLFALVMFAGLAGLVWVLSHLSAPAGRPRAGAMEDTSLAAHIEGCPWCSQDSKSPSHCPALRRQRRAYGRVPRRDVGRRAAD